MTGAIYMLSSPSENILRKSGKFISRKLILSFEDDSFVELKTSPTSGLNTLLTSNKNNYPPSLFWFNFWSSEFFEKWMKRYQTDISALRLEFGSKWETFWKINMKILLILKSWLLEDAKWSFVATTINFDKKK